MGIFGKRHNYGSSISPRYEPRSLEEYKTSLPPNPNPYNFRVLFEKQVGTNLVAMVLYPDATNYEGVKVLLLKDTKTLKDLKKFDPHFFEGNNLLARFVPDDNGWELAIKVAEMLKSSNHLNGIKD